MQASVQIEKEIYIETYTTTIPILKRIVRKQTTSMCIDPFEKNYDCVKTVGEIEKRAHKHIKR